MTCPLEFVFEPHEPIFSVTYDDPASPSFDEERTASTIAGVNCERDAVLQRMRMCSFDISDIDGIEYWARELPEGDWHKWKITIYNNPIAVVEMAKEHSSSPASTSASPSPSPASTSWTEASCPGKSPYQEVCCLGTKCEWHKGCKGCGREVPI